MLQYALSLLIIFAIYLIAQLFDLKNIQGK